VQADRHAIMKRVRNAIDVRRNDIRLIALMADATHHAIEIRLQAVSTSLPTAA
jgi:hypothetical protein